MPISLFFSAFLDTNYHCVSAIDSSDLTYAGRPHGGVATLWKSRINADVSPIQCETKRLCGVKVNMNGESVIMLCAYMPSSNSSNREQKLFDIVSEIASINNLYQSYKMILGGDFNVNLNSLDNRNLVHIIKQLFNSCALTNCSDDDRFRDSIKFTFESKATMHKH